MSIIYSYPEQGALNANDMLIGTSAEKVGGKQKNITRNFTIQQIADFINQGTGFVNPAASDFQIPVFNQQGKKITGSIMSQNIYPNGSAITITGSLTVTNGATIGDSINDIRLQSPTALIGPIKDANSALSTGNQILLSTPSGNVIWQNYEAGLTYEGTWDASTNTPTLTSGQGVSGHFYIVSVAGNTNLDGNSDWHIGDWAVFFDAGGGGAAGWQKIDNTSVLTGSGTANTFAMWTATETLNDSLLSQDAGATKVIVDGLLEVKGDGASQDGRIKLNCSQNSHGVTIQSPPHSAGASYTLILPTSTGTSGQTLTTDGSDPAQLTWTDKSPGTVTGTGTQNYVAKWSTSGGGIENSSIFSDAGGNVGIGTTSPSANIHIDSSDNFLGYFESTNNKAYIGIGDNDTTFFISAENSKASIGQQTGAHADNLNYNLTDKRLGIGTTSPGAKLDVADSEPIIRLTDTRLLDNGQWDNVSLGKIEFKTSDTTTPGARVLSEIQAYSSVAAASGPESELRFKTSTTTDSTPQNRLTIQAGGNVGIGTTSPDAKLDIVSSGDEIIRLETSSSTGSPFVSFFQNNTRRSYIQHQDTSDNLAFASEYGGMRFLTGTNGSNEAERMRITDNGDVGIGTTSPNGKVHIYEGSSGQSNPNAAANSLILEDNASNGLSILTPDTGTGSIFFGDNNDNYVGGFRYDHSNNSLDVNVNNATALSIDSSRNIGIGTSTPSVSLDISGTDAIQVPAGATTDRPVTGVSNGMFRYNNTSNSFEGYINGNWGAIGGSAGGGLVFRGTFDASTGAITGGGSLYTCPAGGTGGTVDIAVGDLYIVTTAGSFYCSGTNLNVGDEVICITAATAGNSSASDWNAVASGGGLTGSGTTNYIPKFTSSTAIGNSNIFEDASGNVGIGTNSPVGKFEVTDGSSSINFQEYNNGAAIFLDGVNGDFTGGDYYHILANGSSYLGLGGYSGGTTPLNIDSSGNVGIGTSSPAEKLSVSGDSNVTGKLAVGLSSAHGTYDFYNQNTAYFNGAVTIDDVFTQSGGSSSSFSGNVGVGTTSPARDFHVHSSALTDIHITNSDTGSTLTDGATITMAALDLLINNREAGSLQFRTSGTERMRIDSNGKVGIGTDAPEVSLDLGNNTDAIRVPNGATADRPSGILPGMIRYNTTTNEFEGYSGTLNVSGSWGSLGGGVPTITKQLFQVTASTPTFTLNVNPQNANYVNIFIDGVYQNSNTYTVTTTSGTTTVTLNTAAPAGTSVEIISTT